MGWHRTSRFFSWLGELRLLYLAGLYVLLGLSLIWGFEASEKSIRLVGLALQVLGIGTVIWGISATRKQFGHPPVISLVLSWLRRCPLIRRPAYLQPEGISVGASALGGRLVTAFTPNPSAPLEERLEHIEKGLETLQKRIEGAESQIDRESSIAYGKVLVETRAREAADKEIMSALESSSTGGIHISAIGALWLFVGVILSTASHELAAWLA
jgi:hypothetical protein